VLYVFGGQSDMCNPSMMRDKLENTGIGRGGSGGVAAGRVKSVFLDDKGHLLAQEAVTECADAATSFWGEELRRWREEEDAFLRGQWMKKAQAERVRVDGRWLKEVGPPPARTGRATTDGDSKLKL
jgi:hypothetical protein